MEFLPRILSCANDVLTSGEWERSQRLAFFAVQPPDIGDGRIV